VSKPKEPKPIDGKSIIEQAKNKVKTQKQNEKETNTMNKKHIIVTIILTLSFLSSLAGMFIVGINYEKGISNRVTNEAKSLVTLTAEAKK
jgi:flagellar basal body-associated protein FliL